MNTRILALVTVAALGVGGIWWATQEGESELEGLQSGSDASVPGAPETADESDLAALEGPDSPVAESRTLLEEGAALGDLDADKEPLATWELEDSSWVEVTVVLPEGTPAGEKTFALATSKRLAPAKILGDQGPIAALRQGREPRLAGGVLAAAPVGEDGTVRLSLPPDTGEAWISVEGSFVYSMEAEHLTEMGETRAVTLRPALGAWITGEVRAQDPQASVGDVEVELDWSLNTALQLGAAGAEELNRSTITDQDGRFDFFAVPSGRAVSTRTRSETLARFFSDDLLTVAGERHSLEITLSTGGTVHGLVVDEAGTPMADVDVSAMGREFFGNPTQDLREVTTGEDGSYELAGLTPGTVWLRARYDDYQEQLGEPFQLADGERLHAANIVLGRGLALAGKVTFPDGRAVEGAEVKLSPDMSGNPSGSPMDPRLFVGADNESTTDAAGAFEIHGLGEGPWAVSVKYRVEDENSSEESGLWTALQSPLSAPSEALEFTLDPPIRLVGVVTGSANEPITSFTVTGERSGTQWYMPASETRMETFEPEDGRFVLEDLRSGPWTFTVEAEGMAPSAGVKLTLPTEEAAAFTLRKPIRLSGQVLDPNGLPVAGAEIGEELDAQQMIQSMSAGDRITTRTDGAGLFVLNGLAPGASSISAKKDGWAPSEGFAYELSEGQSIEDVVLVMRRGGTITGEVFGPDGEPASECMLVIQMTTLDERRIGNADANGRFEEVGLKPGTWQVQAFPGIKSMQPESGGTLDTGALIKALKMASVELADEATEHVVLGSPPASPVRVRGTVSLAGDPVAELTISFALAGGGGLERLKIGTTDSDGRYELVLDEPGDYLVTVQSTGTPGMQNSVEFPRVIPETDAFKLDIAMPAGRISGRVTGPDGGPCQDTRVTLSMQSGQIFGTMMGGQYNETTTDQDGRYEILFVRPGDYAIAAGGTLLGGLLGGNDQFGRSVQSLVVEENSSSVADFKLESPGELHGVVRDSAGAPVADASIFLRDEDGRLLELFSFQATGASGAFTYDGLAPGEYTLSARSKLLASETNVPVRIRSGEITEATVTVNAGTLMLVSLKDKSGADVRSRVSVRNENGHEMNGMLSVSELMARLSGGIDGKEQRVGPLPVGTYEVTAAAEDGRSASRRIKIKGKPEKKVRLRLR